MLDPTGQIAAALDRALARGEIGLQVAAYLDGKLVLDVWGGSADQTTGRVVDGDTLFTVFSTSKGIAATCVHLLAERGQLDYDEPIARYWPEFAQNGKERATVRQALSHSIESRPLFEDQVGAVLDLAVEQRVDAIRDSVGIRAGIKGPGKSMRNSSLSMDILSPVSLFRTHHSSRSLATMASSRYSSRR